VHAVLPLIHAHTGNVSMHLKQDLLCNAQRQIWTERHFMHYMNMIKLLFHNKCLLVFLSGTMHAYGVLLLFQRQLVQACDTTCKACSNWKCFMQLKLLCIAHLKCLCNMIHAYAVKQLSQQMWLNTCRVTTNVYTLLEMLHAFEKRYYMQCIKKVLYHFRLHA